MGRLKSTIIITAGVSSLVGATAQAQEKASIPVGTFELTPTLNVSLNKDSNVTRSSTGKIDSWITVLNPELKLGKQIGENKLYVGVNATKGIYHSSEDDDYTDYQLFTSGEFEFDRRNRISGSLNHLSGHDGRGTVYSIGAGNLLQGVDKYTRNSLAATYSYGAMSASANLDVNLLIRDIDYDIDVLDSNPERLRDRKEKNIGSTFYYGISPTTDLLG
ncbi:outer membrane beta-barrel protein [Paraglaciecola aquimarina]|uniref:Outer membrane beta-barrel protein n=1 Tax=Paraglaciecola aquimarina TaxID=1235557 RepID=A0ABU3T1B6_9ALTE|nr:outer membrane beta-barrel protein [Paraglaciecola aquimarina]MDU0356012.1 outer membrane beta-barrel protein [Paraglaciecola aquimarina]